MTNSRTRIVVALALAGVLVVIAAVAGIVAVAVHRANTPDPEITAYAHGKAVTVPPYRYCTVTQSGDTGQLGLDCRESELTIALDTPPGYPVQLSLPPKIADAPWIMRLEYVHPDGSEATHLATYRDYPDGTLAVTVDSRPEPDLRLVGIELQLVVPVRDEAGNEGFAPYQAWSIKTA
ncbi:DUF2771 domain-containing protein [Nocardia transvalensis]|uniref:DUF2771 domain-containing protein n=1 Tax=Nocardia transvalensis TaxID=37333 RepID=UPI001895A6F5|nr:DUF2771 domain-containing protein [Nocardia transvalensis]MBF6332552.1 DUF2771 domain-containing protein [Nocardia transvalensis]